MPAGDPLRAAEAVALEAFDLAEALGDNNTALAACMLGIWGFVRYGAAMMVSTPEFRMWTERADRLASPETSQRVVADVALFYLLRLRSGKWAEGRALTTRALELARRLDDPYALWFAALPNLELAAVSDLPTFETCRRLAQEVPDWPREGVPVVILAWVLHSCAVFSLLGGSRNRAEALWNELEELGERTGDSQPILLSLNGTNLLLSMDGQLEETIQGVQRLNDKAEELGSPVLGRMIGALAAYSPLMYLGRVEEALASIRQLPQWRAPLAAIFLARLGRRAEAQEMLHELLQTGVEAGENGMPWSWFNSLLNLAVELADRDAARTIAPRLAGLDKSTPEVYDGRSLGAASAFLGDHEGARAHYQAAVESWVEVQNRPEIALTRLQLAELLLEHYPDDRAEAMEHLDFAIGELRDMKMQPSLERALSHRDILKA